MNSADAIRAAAVRLDGTVHDYDALLADIGERSHVLLGEATHGTREFYRMRAQITQRLVAERDFNAVAVEADWPDAYRLNRFVRGDGDDMDARSDRRDGRSATLGTRWSRSARAIDQCQLHRR
jgi:erythromycin esterase-like protein